MNTINDVKNLALELMSTQFTIKANYGTYTISAKDMGYSFEFDNAKRMFGRCFYISKKISLSLPLCKANLDKLHTEIRNTILHEIVHAFCVYVYGIKNGKGHGANWKSIAKQIGCTGDRCYTSEKVNSVLSKYTLVCDSCGKKSPKYKKPKREAACGICCKNHNFGRYTDKFKLKLVVNY